MSKRYLLIMVAAVALAAMLGCTASIPEDSLLEKNWGRSYESAVILQTANPNAGESLEPIEGMDGAAAVGAHRNRLGLTSEK